MELLSLKLIVLGISGVIRLFFGLIPLVLIQTLTKNVSGKAGHRIVKYVISVLMFFGGGVLLATCFLHMMPEVRESFKDLRSELPVPELIFIGGFFLVYLLEELVHSCLHRRLSSSKSSSLHHKNKRKQTTHEIQKYFNQNDFFQNSLHHPQETHNGIPTTGMSPNSIGLQNLPGRHVGLIPRVRSPDTKATKYGSGNGYESNFPIDHSFSPGHPNYTDIDPDWWREGIHGNSQVTLVSASGLSISTLDEIPLGNGNKGHISISPKDSVMVKNGSSSDWSPSASPTSSNINHEVKEHSHFPVDIGNETESLSGAIRNLLIIIAISFHGIFEGLAIGLQGTEKDVWALFLAVSIHECTILFCIGIELISAGTKTIRMISYILVVSLVSPVGIAIGIVISEKAVGGTAAQTLLIGSLQGLAAGTLLYVTFFEVFAAEGRKLHNKFIHILVAIVGFIMMASLEFIGSHSHAHGHSHENPMKNQISNDGLNLTTESISHESEDYDGDHGHSHDHQNEHNHHSH